MEFLKRLSDALDVLDGASDTEDADQNNTPASTAPGRKKRLVGGVRGGLRAEQVGNRKVEEEDDVDVDDYDFHYEDPSELSTTRSAAPPPDPTIVYEGFLLKKDHYSAELLRRWFRLYKSGRLAYYTDRQCTELKGFRKLLGPDHKQLAFASLVDMPSTPHTTTTTTTTSSSSSSTRASHTPLPPPPPPQPVMLVIEFTGGDRLHSGLTCLAHSREQARAWASAINSLQEGFGLGRAIDQRLHERGTCAHQDDGSLISGWLSCKISKSLIHKPPPPHWKRYYFVLDKKHLSYYLDKPTTPESKPQGKLVLMVDEAPSVLPTVLVGDLLQGFHTFTLVLPEKELLLAASTEVDRRQWIARFKTVGIKLNEPNGKRM